MPDVPPGIEAMAATLWRRVYKKCQEIARQEITNEFKQAWRGGKLDAAYLTNRIPFLVLPQNHGTVLLSTTDIPANSDFGTKHITFPNPYPGTTLTAGASAGATSITVASTAGLVKGSVIRLTQAGGSHLTEKATISAINQTTKALTIGALTNPYSTSDTVLVIPDVTLGSGDIGWDATRTNIDNTGFDLTLARRVSLTNSEGGSYSQHFAIGDTVHDHVITFPVAYQSAPSVLPNTDDPAFAPSVFGITTTGCTIRITHINTSASGTIGYSPTGITATDNSAVGSTGGPSANITSDPLTRTDPTWGPEDASTSTDNPGTTNTTAIGHTHSVPSGTDASGGTTGTGGPTHAHSMPDHHHDHHHAHDLSAHAHGTPAHDHGLTEPVDGSGNVGHNHLFAGDTTAVTAASDHTITWTAFGTRTAPAVTKEASWMAQGA